MKYLKLFESHIGYNTTWSKNNISISLKDVNDYLDYKKISIKIIDPKSIEHLLIKTKRDEKRINDANLKYPIILTQKDGKITHILDGQHRVVKCIQNNINKIKSKILDLDNAPQEYQDIF